MSNLESPFEIDPFQRNLTPLPAKTGDAGKPLAVSAQVLSPEHPLNPAERGSALEAGSGAVERLETGSGSDGQLFPPAPSRWKFWKRHRRRDEQAEALRQGASEMVDLMRSIRDHLKAESLNKDNVLRTVTPLPRVVENLQAMSARQGDTGRILSELRTTLEQRSERDGLLLRSLHRIGSTMEKVETTFEQLNQTLAGMECSNAHTAKSMEALGERVSESGRFMNESITQLRASEHDFAQYMFQSSRRSGRGMVAMCCCLLLSVVSVAFMFQENRKLLAAVQKNGALVVQVPRGQAAPASSPEGKADASRLAVQDEAVGREEAPASGQENVVPVDTEGSGLLSVTE